MAAPGGRSKCSELWSKAAPQQCVDRSRNEQEEGSIVHRRSEGRRSVGLHPCDSVVGVWKVDCMVEDARSGEGKDTPVTGNGE